MAVEKRIQLEDDTGVQIPEDGAMNSDVEVTLEDQQEIAAAEAMGMIPQEDVGMELEVEDHEANLAEMLDDQELNLIATELSESFQNDKDSREDYDSIAEEGVTLLGLQDENGDEPFPGACGATHPALTQAVVKFQAKAYKELFPTEGPVRTRIIGAQTPQKTEQANRVRHFLNYQTQLQMPEYGPELDRLLFYVGLYGSAFKKTYWDATLQRPRTQYVKAQDFYVDYYASDLETAERFTHTYSMSQNEIRKYQLAGMFRDTEVMDSPMDGESNAEETANEAIGVTRPSMQKERVEILEMHVNLDLPGFEDANGIALPYIVHMTDDNTILAIRRNWNQEDQTRKKKHFFTHFTMIPGLGFYGYGYLHLIGGLTKTATSSMRQLIDAGTFANLPGGFKAHGLRVLAPDEPIAPGEWREVNSPAGDLGKALQPLPFKEPSGTLFNLMQYVVNTAKEFADSSDHIVDNASNYGPVGTTMALLEQSSKMFSAVHKRLHSAQSKDLRILARLDHEYLPDMYPYEVAGGAQQVFKQDFNLKSIDVVPVTDPNMPSESHRIAKINAIMTIAQQQPQSYNMEQIGMELFQAMGIDEPQRYLKKKQQPISADPITENMAVMKGAPLQAKPEQNHDAHLVTHAMMLQNKTYQGNPQLVQLLTSHIQDHMAMKYRQEMMQMIQDPRMQQMIMAGQPLPPEIENQVALMAANAADQVNKLDIEKEKILSGEKDKEDPVSKQLELQQMELDLKRQVHMDKIALQESKMIIDDENKDEDRLLKAEQMNMKFAGDVARDAKKTVSIAMKGINKDV
jgi:hypothetical protein